MSDDELLVAWTSLSLPFQDWTHRAHVRVAFILLSRHSFDEALNHMRDSVKRYNSHNAVPESPTSGYNETTTHAFLHLIASVRAAYGKLYPTSDSEMFCDAHPQFLSRHILRLFYSPQRRMHPDAKHTFIEPDLAPLPIILQA